MKLCRRMAPWGVCYPSRTPCLRVVGSRLEHETNELGQSFIGNTQGESHEHRLARIAYRTERSEPEHKHSFFISISSIRYTEHCGRREKPRGRATTLNQAETYRSTISSTSRSCSPEPSNSVRAAIPPPPSLLIINLRIEASSH